MASDPDRQTDRQTDIQTYSQSNVALNAAALESSCHFHIFSHSLGHYLARREEVLKRVLSKSAVGLPIPSQGAVSVSSGTAASSSTPVACPRHVPANNVASSSTPTTRQAPTVATAASTASSSALATPHIHIPDANLQGASAGSKQQPKSRFDNWGSVAGPSSAGGLAGHLCMVHITEEVRNAGHNMLGPLLASLKSTGVWLHMSGLNNFVERAAQQTARTKVVVVNSTNESHMSAPGIVCRALGCHLVSMDSFAKHILHGKQAENIKFAPCRQKALQIHICKAFSRQHPGEAGAVRAVIAVLGWTELLSSKDTRRLYSEYFAGHGERSRPWIKIRAITAESDLAERGAKHKDKCPRLFVSVREFIKEISVSDRLGILPHIVR